MYTSETWDMIIRLAEFGKRLSNLSGLSEDEHREQLKTFYRIAKSIQRLPEQQLNQRYEHGLFDTYLIAEFNIRVQDDDTSDAGGNLNQLTEQDSTPPSEDQLRGLGFSDDDIQDLL